MANPDLNYYFVPVFLLTLGELSSSTTRWHGFPQTGICTDFGFQKPESRDLAVQTLGLQPGSFSKLFLKESLSLQN